MIKNVFKISIFLLFILLVICCKSDRPPIKKETPKINTAAQPIKINKINFYFENSGSINGYLDGDNFQQTVYRVLKNSESDSLIPYFVNTKEYFEPNIIDKIVKKNIKTHGIGNSDHKFIFTNAIKNTTGNNLSIVITDGIYSMKDGNISIVAIDIENAFIRALKANKNNIETVVLKMSSNFKGTYYTESKDCANVVITSSQERPYYILLFGNKQVIDKALNEIVIIEDLEGYKEQARFLITKDLKVNYTVLTKGEEKAGNYKSKGHSKLFNIKEIEDAEKFSKSGLLLKDRYLQFGIAVDYSNLSIPNNYLIDSLNYSIEETTGYKVSEIKSVQDLSKNSQSYKWIQVLNKKGNMNYTHIIIVKAKSNLYGDLKVNLDINFPSWIKETGSENDCEIIGDIKTTFAFDRLMNGISKAYEKVNNKNKFFKLKINIKP